MLGAHVIGFYEKNSVNRLSRVAPIADRMDTNDFKFSRSPYAIDSVRSSVSSRVQRNSPQRHSPERAEAAPTPIAEGPGEVQHAGSPPQPGTSPQSEGDAAGAGLNPFGTNVVIFERWHPSPIDLTVQKPIQLGRMWRPIRTRRISCGIDWSRRILMRRRDSRRPIALLLVHLGVKAT